MKDQVADFARPGDSSQRKIPVTKVATIGGGAATITATLLWAFGCLKGHQWYWPDDALMLNWAAGLSPGLYMIWLKFQHKLGLDEEGGS